MPSASVFSHSSIIGLRVRGQAVQAPPSDNAPALLRLAVHPLVKALAALFAELLLARQASRTDDLRAPAAASTLATLKATSRPTMSASSIGPTGMPKFSAAASIFSFGVPSASTLHGFEHIRRKRAVHEEARHGFHDQRHLADARDEARALAHLLLAALRTAHHLDQRQSATGLKKCRPMRRLGSFSPVAICSMGSDEVLVARMRRAAPSAQARRTAFASLRDFRR